MTKERWSSQRIFIIAALGGAIGVGNLWRFPYLCYDHGGGAFLIPYVIALIVVGIPLLILEFGIGFKTDMTPARAFNKMFGPKYEWIGWLGILIAYGIALYYVMLIAFGMNYIWFTINQDYYGDPVGFFHDFSGLQDTNEMFIPKTINLMVVGALTLVWGWIYVSIRKGVKSVEKMVWLTVMLPFVIIAIFVLYGITLPGAATGLNYYFSPNWEYLAKGETWLAAFSQIFFTLGLGMGFAVVYASFLPRKSSIIRNALIVSVTNSMTSFFLGIGVFSVVGYLAEKTGQPVTEVAGSGGIGLVFIVFPTVIELLPWLATIFGVLFFLLFVTLGIDSGFALVEGFTSSVSDRFRLDYHKFLLAALLIGFFVSLWFATDSGLVWLDVIDHYMGFYLIVICGLLEILVVLTHYTPKRFITELNKESTDGMNYRLWGLMAYIAVIMMVVLLIWNGYHDIVVSWYGADDGYPLWPNLIGWSLVIILPLACKILAGNLKEMPVEHDDDEPGK